MVAAHNPASRLDLAFQQTQQAVSGSQYNAETIMVVQSAAAPYKSEPVVDRLAYLLDREPQCTALQDHLRRRNSTSPLCVIATGIDKDLPSAIGLTLVDFVSRRVLSEQGLRDFRPPPRPLCRRWPNPSDIEAIWRVVGTIFLELSPLLNPRLVPAAFAELSSSTAFGFNLDLSAWPKHASTLCSWLDSLQACAPNPKALVLAVVVIGGGPDERVQLESVRDNLYASYENNPDVLVLPMLSAVTRRDIRNWRQELLEEVGDRVNEAELETLVLDLFPGELSERHIGEIWDVVRRKVQSAWILR